MISLANIYIEDEKTFPCMYFVFKKLIKNTLAREIET